MMKIQAGVRQHWPYAMKVTGVHCLAYLESIHRSCQIQTEQMREMIKFATVEHYDRSDLAGTAKGRNIMQKLHEIEDNLLQSVQIKQQIQGEVR